MKKIVIAISFLPVLSFAQNYMAKDEILSSGVQAFTFKTDCERIKSQVCIDVGNYPSSVFSELNIQVDDLENPKYSKNEIYECESLTDCELAHMTKSCEDEGEQSILNSDLMQVYCSRQIGFHKKIEAQVVPDPVKVQNWENQKIIDAQKKALDNAINVALGKIECGKRVIGHLIIRNSTKGLTTSQIAEMTSNYSVIKSLLETGSHVTAKEHIEDVAADGFLITEADKTALASETQKCIEL